MLRKKIPRMTYGVRVQDILAWVWAAFSSRQLTPSYSMYILDSELLRPTSLTTESGHNLFMNTFQHIIVIYFLIKS